MHRDIFQRHAPSLRLLDVLFDDIQIILMRIGHTLSMPRSDLLVLLARLMVIAVVPAAALAAEGFAIFRSADRGYSWTRADEGLPGDSRVNAFGALGGSVFAGTDAGVFMSRDEGRSWQSATGVAMASGRILCFATLEGSVYAGTDGRGILVSSDGGISWESNAGFPRVKVRSLLAHRGELYAGTDANGVLVSGDDGRSWRQQREGLPDGAQVFALAAVRGRLFAGLYARGLFVWHELDQRWSKAGEVTPLALASVGGVLVAGHNPGGIQWSGDLGNHWSQATVNIPGQSTLSLSNPADELSGDAPVWELASSDDLAVAGVATGIYLSENQGRTWVRARRGLPAASPGVSFLVRGSLVLAGTVTPE